MIKDDKAVMEPNDRVRQLKVIPGVRREPGFDEAAQTIAPNAKGAAERERKVNGIEEFITAEECVEETPGIAEPYFRNALRLA